MASLEPLMTLDLTLSFVPLGDTPSGNRIDVTFSGTATSPRWEGEKPVEGIDFVTVGKDGVTSLEIRGRVGEGDDVIGYKAEGRSTGEGILEVFTFNTASEKSADLNNMVAVGFGTQVKNKLTLELFSPKR